MGEKLLGKKQQFAHLMETVQETDNKKRGASTPRIISNEWDMKPVSLRQDSLVEARSANDKGWIFRFYPTEPAGWVVNGGSGVFPPVEPTSIHLKAVTANQKMNAEIVRTGNFWHATIHHPVRDGLSQM